MWLIWLIMADYTDQDEERILTLFKITFAFALADLFILIEFNISLESGIIKNS